MSEAATEQTTETQTAGEQQPTGGKADGGEQKEQTFTQADIDRVVRERVKREREKFADYDDLKAKAGEATTAEERIAKLEKEIKASQHEALKRRVQAAHAISDEDADLFLTGDDEDTLTAQAKRLTAREAERKKQGNHVPGEGNNTRPDETGDAAFAASLFRPPGE